MQEYEIRKYGRSKHFVCTAMISKDRTDWQPALVKDVSSGGMNFVLTDELEANVELWLKLHIEGFLSEFNCIAQGVIRHRRTCSEGFIYGLQFINLSDDIKIQIDQNVRGDRPVSGEPYMKD